MAEVAALKEQRDAEHEIANTFSKDLELVDKELSALRKDLDVANKANNELFSTLQKLRLENYDLVSVFSSLIEPLRFFVTFFYALFLGRSIKKEQIRFVQGKKFSKRK